MNANAEKSLIGMVLFAFIDAVIVYFANRYALPFSIMWWCAVLSAGCAMWISRFCNRIYNRNIFSDCSPLSAVISMV